MSVWVGRDLSGNIIRVAGRRQRDATEELAANNPEVVAYRRARADARAGSKAPLTAEELFDIGVAKLLWTNADRPRPRP